MNELTKQQLILLALLVSFVTSLSTGIVTVSLMDQAPAGVTHTISQVIEKTIQQAAPEQDAAVGAVAPTLDEELSSSVASVSPSVVKISDSRSGSIYGLALTLSASGVLLTDRSVVAHGAGYLVAMVSGTDILVTVVEEQQGGDIVFLEPITPISVVSTSSVPFTPISLAPSPSLGQTVFSLAGTSTAILGEGTITELSSVASSASSTDPIGTSIAASRTAIGSPLFDMNGKVIGIRTSSLSSKNGASFYPIAPLMPAVPVIK